MVNRIDNSQYSNSIENCSFVKTVLMIIVVLYHSILFWVNGKPSVPRIKAGRV